MADNAGSRFFEGLRVTADHLRHTQDRLWEAVGDLRLALGRGRIAWGLRVDLVGGNLRVSPGVAFSPEGVRLAVDTETDVPLPATPLPLIVRLVPVNEDRASLQVGGVPTFVTLRADVTVLEEAGAPADDTALDIATVVDAALDPATTATGPMVSQDPTLFIVAGHHGHSGAFLQDEQGRWSYDGPQIAGLDALRADLLALEANAVELGDRLVTVEALEPRVTALETLPAQLAALESDAARQADVAGLDARIVPLEALPGQLSALAQQLAALEAQVAGLPAGGGTFDTSELEAMIDEVATEVASLSALPGELARLDQRLSALEQRVASIGSGSGSGGGIDPEWPRIVKSSWPHSQNLSPDEAVQALEQVTLDLSEPVSDNILRTVPEVVQVWIEPIPADIRRQIGLSPVALAGRIQYGDGVIAWSTIADPGMLASVLKNGARVMLRVHCGALADQADRAFSSSLEGLTGHESPPVPGGVLESWFMVPQG